MTRWRNDVPQNRQWPEEGALGMADGQSIEWGLTLTAVINSQPPKAFVTSVYGRSRSVLAAAI